MFSKVRLFVVAAAVFAMGGLAGCASTSSSKVYKISDPETIKVIEGEVLDFKLLTKKELSLMDSAITGASAANIGNAPVQGALLAVDVLSSLSDGEWKPFYIKIKEKDSGEEVELLSKTIKYRNEKQFEPGDQAIAVIRKYGKFMTYNITKYPELLEIIN